MRHVRMAATAAVIGLCAAAWAGEARVTTRTYESVSVRDGNTVRTTGTVADEQGQVIRKLAGQTVLDGQVRRHEHTVTDVAGKTLRTNETTVVPNGPGSWRRDTTVRTHRGATWQVEEVRVREDDTTRVSRTVAATNPQGETRTRYFTGQWVRQGGTTTHAGTWTDADGQTVATVSGSRTRSGNSATGHREVRDPAGQVVRTRDGTASWSTDGSTVTRQATVTVTQHATPETTGWRRSAAGTATRDGTRTERRTVVTTTRD